MMQWLQYTGPIYGAYKRYSVRQQLVNTKFRYYKIVCDKLFLNVEPLITARDRIPAAAYSVADRHSSVTY